MITELVTLINTPILIRYVAPADDLSDDPAVNPTYDPLTELVPGCHPDVDPSYDPRT